MIKADAGMKVKTLLAFLLVFSGFFAQAVEPPPATDEEKIKEIDAQEFHVRVTRKSTSGKVLLFEDASENNPKPGKILLIRSSKEDVVAVRVLKNYPPTSPIGFGNTKFAAKVVLPIQEPSTGVDYRALKKIGDRMMNLITEREKRTALEEGEVVTDEDLAREVAPDDNELDRGIPPPGKGAPDTTDVELRPEPVFDRSGAELRPEDIEVLDEDEPYAELTAQEERPLDPTRHALTGQIGYLRGVDKDGGAANYIGMGLRYGINFLNIAFFRRRNLQDSMTLEGSMFLYSISGFRVQDPADSVTVMPLIGALRYNLHFGEGFTPFGYAGVVYNNIVQSDATGTDVLNTTRIALGGGAMVRLGPGWAVRIDAGTDLFAIGAVLKF